MNKVRTFRYERKFVIPELNIQEVESIVNLHPAMFSEIFHKRSVNNIYFDSPELNNYFDNVGGNMQRIKTRIRWYGELFDNIEKPVLELKIKNGLLGKKKLFPLYPFKLDGSFSINTLKLIFTKSDIPEFIKMELKTLDPVLLNSYTRKYYQSADKRYRITIDTDQVFYQIGFRSNSFLNKLRDNVNVILELKYNIDADDDAKHITEHFPFRLTKSSKYVAGIKKVYVQ